MSETALAKKEPKTLAGDLERVLIMGDLAQLKPEERIQYYNAFCESVGLNPLTRPLDYIVLNGKMVLYANRSCTEQLRKNHSISIEPLEDKVMNDVYIVTAKAHNGAGRTDCSRGAVNIAGLKGEALANALMKAETKAKRRVTLSICGLGLLDESEIDSVQPNELPEREPNMTVRCAHCNSEAGHTADCPTRQPKQEPKKIAPKPKAQKATEPEQPKQTEGKVLAPETSKAKWFYVAEVKDLKTSTGTKYQVWKGNFRGSGDRLDLNVFHKTLHENSKFAVAAWVECEITSKPSTKDPSRTLYSLEKVLNSEDKNGMTKWMDNEPLTDEQSTAQFTDGGMSAEDAGFDVP